MTSAMPGAMRGARARVLALVLVLMLLLGEATSPSRRSEPRRRIAARSGPDAPRMPVMVARRVPAARGRCPQLAKRPVRRERHCTRRLT